MNSVTTWKELLALATVRKARATAVLIFTFLALSAQTQGQEAPTIKKHFPNSPGWITIEWEHSGDDVYYFVVERQGPPYSQNDIVGIAELNSPTRQFTDMFLKAATAYNHRVCAVYDYHRTCSGWISTTTDPPPSSGGSGGGTSSPPRPKHELRTPVLTATSNHPLTITLHWGSDSVDNYTLGNVQLYRDGQITYDAKKYPGFTPEYVDNGKMIDSGNATGQTLRPNTEYTYKVCFIGIAEADGQTKCSREIVAMGKPIAPTTPVDVKVALTQLGGRAALGGAVRLRPRPKVSVTWRNTDVPGQFITIEALETQAPGDMIAGGAIQTAPRQRWIEATRVSAKDGPTSLTIDRPVSLITTDTGLSTYRVCAVAPKLGDAGKVCSQLVSLP